jgi:hypothetical protein
MDYFENLTSKQKKPTQEPSKPQKPQALSSEELKRRQEQKK